MITIEPLTWDHLNQCQDIIRLEDRMEWAAGCGQGILEQLADVGLGEHSKVALSDGVPQLIWGVDKTREEGVGSAWMFATIHASRLRLALHKAVLPEIEELHRAYPTLIAWSDRRNTLHHTWLRWLGFKEITSAYYGTMGLPFIYFRKEQPCALPE